VYKSNLKKISLAVCLAFMPFYGNAAGLGKLNVSSGLGEPLKAEIELVSVTPDELSTLVGSVASEDAYNNQGITRLDVHSNIKVDLVNNANGVSVLKLRTALPIDDPYLDVLIQLDWASGRLLREYTVLLDPPGYKDTIQELAPSTVSLPAVPLSATVASQAVEASKSSTSESELIAKEIKSEAPVKTKDPAEPVSSAGVVTKRGDTLHSLARDVLVEGVSQDQMLVGLYEANKEVFVDGNMNRLKVGQIIKAPEKEVLTAIDNQQAKQLIKLHLSSWNQYRQSLSDIVKKSPTLADSSEQKQVSSGKIASAEDKAQASKVSPKDVVKLSAGTTVNDSSLKADTELSAKIATLQEDAAAREKALKEVQDRTSELEKQIADLQQLLALRNQSMADMQKNVEAKAQVAEMKPAAKATDKVIKVETVPELVVEASFINRLLDTQGNLAIVGGAATVTLLSAAWMYLRNKRRKEIYSSEEEAETLESAPTLQAPKISLDGINLDLTQSEPEEKLMEEIVPETEEVTFDFPVSDVKEMTSVGGSENQEVEVKLDLVAAYIEMDDKEGARELLEEVIKEGGGQQRERAEKLLADLA